MSREQKKLASTEAAPFATPPGGAAIVPAAEEATVPSSTSSSSSSLAGSASVGPQSAPSTDTDTSDTDIATADIVVPSSVPRIRPLNPADMNKEEMDEWVAELHQSTREAIAYGRAHSAGCPPVRFSGGEMTPRHWTQRCVILIIAILTLLSTLHS